MLPLMSTTAATRWPQLLRSSSRGDRAYPARLFQGSPLSTQGPAEGFQGPNHQGGGGGGLSLRTATGCPTSLSPLCARGWGQSRPGGDKEGVEKN